MSSFSAQRNLSTLILIGLVAGIACGLIFGEYAAILSFLGDAFVGLLQMTVLPYITVTLIANIGKLKPAEAKRFGAYAGMFFIISAVATLAIIVLLPMALPERESASFFSTSMLQEPTETNLLALFIPSNPFHSLANNIVPAVVLFCIAVGLGMMTLPRKSSALAQLDFVASVLARVNYYLIQITPIGIFAIAASFAGTMQVEDLVRLKAYILLYTVATAVIGFGILLPMLSALTPFTYRELFRAVRAPVLTAFVTGKVFIVLPMLVDAAEKLFARAYSSPEKPSSYARAVTPLAYSFPHAGKLLALLFVPFAAWFVGQPLSLAEYPSFIAIGFFGLFGSPLSAMPFLLDHLRIPADIFQLFLVSGVLTSRLGDALGAIHLLFISILTASALSGQLKITSRSITVFIVSTIAVLVVSVGATKFYLSYDLGTDYDRDQVVNNMHSSFQMAPHTVVHRSVPPTLEKSHETALIRIRRTGILRAGYLADALPFSFFNTADELVGYDIDMAYVLANQLGVDLEFIPFEPQTVARQLDRGDFDIALSGVAMTPEHLEHMRFGGPYMNITVALLVPDHRRLEFRKRVADRNFHGVTIASSSPGGTRGFGSGLFPEASFVHVPTPRMFLKSEGDEADAMIWPAESSSAWTLLYPEFSVILANPVFQVPIGYPIAKYDEEFSEFISNWIAFTEVSPIDEQLYNHWILGTSINRHEPRWSVIRNVLHWID